jgi:ankyrin repeat protein
MGEDGKRFFKLFQESTKDESRAAAREMQKIAKRQTKQNQEFLLFHSLRFLARSKLEMLSWPNSPLLVILQVVDPNILSGEGTPLHQLAFLADPFDYSTHKKQLILANQLIEHGVNVNAVASSGQTPLHSACYGGLVTNLDFVEFLLEKGADPNAQDCRGLTPLMCTPKLAPSAATFLLNWPTTDANITNRSGESFLARVRQAVKFFSVTVARPDNSEQVQHQFLLQQWIAIEEMLVKRGAVDTGITTLE